MFDTSSQERASALLATFGATHFSLSADGELHACVGSQRFAIDGEHVQFTLNDAEQSEEAAWAVINAASAGDPQPAPEAPPKTLFQRLIGAVKG